MSMSWAKPVSACPCSRSDQLVQQKTHLSVDLAHVGAVNARLARELLERPAELLPLVSQLNRPARHAVLKWPSEPCMHAV